MDLLPELTDAQIHFAHRYYPVFEDLKGAILILAGVAMMRQGQAADPGPAPFQDSLKRVSKDLGKAAGVWHAFVPSPAQNEDYQLVAHNLRRLVEIGRQFETASQIGSPPDKVVNKLLQVYTILRGLALRYWRLELVAESGHSHF